MKITDVEVLFLQAPGGGYESPRGDEEAYGIKYMGMVRVKTDAGITAYADMETQPHVARAVVEAPSIGAVPGFEGLSRYWWERTLSKWKGSGTRCIWLNPDFRFKTPKLTLY